MPYQGVSQGLLVRENGWHGRAQSHARCPRQGGKIHDKIAACSALLRQGQTICQDQSTFRIGIADFNGLACTGLNDIPWPEAVGRH